jgi:poly(3-hydroxybutyrate) depolymerase
MSNLRGKVIKFAGQDATVWSGASGGGGPLVIYYYATGSNATVEPPTTLGQAQLDAIIAKGGAVVAQNRTTARGKTTGNNVWYTGDVDIADEIVACGIAKQAIDPRRIHVAGYSAGGIQTTHMWYARSGYVASVLTYSGGSVGINVVPIQDAAHPPAALVTHGAKGSDTYQGVVDFFDTSKSFVADIKAAGGFAIDCDDGGAHSDFTRRTKVAPQALQFFMDHPYGVSPKPYASLPSTFPSYCKIQ